MSYKNIWFGSILTLYCLHAPAFAWEQWQQCPDDPSREYRVDEKKPYRAEFRFLKTENIWATDLPHSRNALIRKTFSKSSPNPDVACSLAGLWEDSGLPSGCVDIREAEPRRVAANEYFFKNPRESQHLPDFLDRQGVPSRFNRHSSTAPSKPVFVSCKLGWLAYIDVSRLWRYPANLDSNHGLVKVVKGFVLGEYYAYGVELRMIDEFRGF